jgi:hypothetical protein
MAEKQPFQLLYATKGSQQGTRRISRRLLPLYRAQLSDETSKEPPGR